MPILIPPPYVLQVLPGNHEAECHTCLTAIAETGNFLPYRTRFRMPSPESGGADSMWYSFNYGPVHFVMVDTSTDFPDAPGDGYVSDTGAVERGGARWSGAGAGRGEARRGGKAVSGVGRWRRSETLGCCTVWCDALL